jgi:myosin heavy subunit
MVKFVKSRTGDYGVIVDQDTCGSWIKLRQKEGLVCLKPTEYTVVDRSFNATESSNMHLEFVKMLKNSMLMAENASAMAHEVADTAEQKLATAKQELAEVESQYESVNQYLTTAKSMNASASQMYGTDNNLLDNFKHKSRVQYLSAKENENKAAEIIAAFTTKQNVYAENAAAANDLAASADENLRMVQQTLNNAVARLTIPQRVMMLFTGGRRTRRR